MQMQPRRSHLCRRRHGFVPRNAPTFVLANAFSRSRYACSSHVHPVPCKEMGRSRTTSQRMEMVSSCIANANHGVVHCDVAMRWRQFGSHDEVRDPTTRRVQKQAKERDACNDADEEQKCLNQPLHILDTVQCVRKIIGMWKNVCLGRLKLLKPRIQVFRRSSSRDG